MYVPLEKLSLGQAGDLSHINQQVKLSPQKQEEGWFGHIPAMRCSSNSRILFFFASSTSPLPVNASLLSEYLDCIASHFSFIRSQSSLDKFLSMLAAIFAFSASLNHFAVSTSSFKLDFVFRCPSIRIQSLSMTKAVCSCTAGATTLEDSAPEDTPPMPSADVPELLIEGANDDSAGTAASPLSATAESNPRSASHNGVAAVAGNSQVGPNFFFLFC